MTSLSTIPEDQSSSNKHAAGYQPELGRKVDVETIAAPFRQEIRTKVLQLKEQGIEAPLLVGILANKDPAALKYAEWTGKACRSDGLRYE